MKNEKNKLLLVCLSLIMVLVLASCDFGHQCDFGEEWKHDAENHWLECECGKQDKAGAVVGTSEWGTIKNCVNYGSIVGTDSVGAIAGKASGTISGCRNYGTYEGTSNVGEIYGSAHNNNHPTVTD